MGKHIFESIGIDWNGTSIFRQSHMPPTEGLRVVPEEAMAALRILRAACLTGIGKQGLPFAEAWMISFDMVKTANGSTKSCGKPSNSSVDAFTWTRNPCRFSKRSSPERLGGPCAMWHHMAPLGFQCLSWRFSGFPIQIFCEYLDFDGS